VKKNANGQFEKEFRCWENDRRVGYFWKEEEKV